MNQKAEALRATLREFFAIKGADPNARLMLWFAGHGHTINGEGFLVPADAPAATEPTFLVNASTYYVFKGLGGAADGNKDRQLSLNELAAFVGREVKTQASRLGWEQTPQLTGDGNRVLAKW